MERHSPRNARRGFTLVELIVVIGIIGILAGVLLTSFSGGTESARAAKCLANMRNLAQGAMGYTAAHGRYPYAGSHAAIGVSGSKTRYYEHLGWISWLSLNDEYHTRRNRGGSVGSFPGAMPNISACCDNEDEAMFAITNGTLWKFVGQSRDTYVCPSHAILAAQQHGVKVRFSYAMSAYFGYDRTRGSGAATSHNSGWVSPNTSKLNADRRLLFAELPFAIPDANDGKNDVSADVAYSTANDTDQVDCVLQYKATVNSKSYNGDWGGTPEAIAFNHKVGKRYCAHVAFADGHVEKLLLPKVSGGLDSQQLTALLAGGADVSFDGKVYNLITDGDK